LFKRSSQLTDRITGLVSTYEALFVVQDMLHRPPTLLHSSVSLSRFGEGFDPVGYVLRCPLDLIFLLVVHLFIWDLKAS
jgi:hypothetical protein